MKVIVKTGAGFEFSYNKILFITYASPKHIELVKSGHVEFYSHIRIWADNVSGLFKEIIMEDEENDSKEDK